MNRDTQGNPKAGRELSSSFRGSGLPGVHRIELNLHNVEQLFNTMDHDAEEFIVSWADESL